MNIDKMINALLMKNSQDRKLVLTEKRTYDNKRTFHFYILTIDDQEKTFVCKKDLFIFLQRMKRGDDNGQT